MDPDDFDLRHSFGPLLKTSDGFKFDVRVGKTDFPHTGERTSGPPALGYNASAMFGALHHLATWFAAKENPSQASSPERPQVVDANTIRHYIESQILTQYPDVVQKLNLDTRTQAERIADCYPPARLKWIENQGQKIPRPLAFYFEFPSTDVAVAVQQQLYANGIIATVTGSLIAMRLNLGFKPGVQSEFWQRLQSSWTQIGNESKVGLPPIDFEEPSDLQTNYDFHVQFLLLKKSRAAHPGNTVASQPFSVGSWFSALPKQQSNIPNLSRLRLIRLTGDSFPEYRSMILDLQKKIYEPARQSPPEEFDALFATGRAIGILLLDGEEIAGKTFAGPLSAFTNERGVLSDPYLRAPDVFYSMDLTVVPEYQRGLGKILKRAVLLQALEEGVSAMHGRNRDRVARGMWAINLSMGAYEIQHLVDDYPDTGPYRDCIYYRCPLAGGREALAADSRDDRAANWSDLPDDFELRLPNLVNGV